VHFDAHRLYRAGFDTLTAADAFILVDIFGFGGGIDPASLILFWAGVVTLG